MKDFKYYLFDFDGTLANSQIFWSTVMYHVLQERGYPVDEEDFEFCTTHFSPERKGHFCAKYGIKDEDFPTRSELLDRIDLFYRTEVDWKEGAEEFLKTVRAQGKPTVLFSATPQPLLAHAVEHLDVSRYFNYIVSVSELGVGKGDPDSYRHCLGVLNADPSECVMFEDAPYSMKTAKELGIYTVAVKERCMDFQMEDILRYSDEYIEKLTDWLD